MTLLLCFQGDHKVTPRLPVPSQIIPPDYVNSKKPLFGIYEGTPTVHNEETVKSNIKCYCTYGSKSK